MIPAVPHSHTLFFLFLSSLFPGSVSLDKVSADFLLQRGKKSDVEPATPSHRAAMIRKRTAHRRDRTEWSEFGEGAAAATAGSSLPLSLSPSSRVCAPLAPQLAFPSFPVPAIVCYSSLTCSCPLCYRICQRTRSQSFFFN